MAAYQYDVASQHAKTKAVCNNLACATVVSEHQFCIQGILLMAAYQYDAASQHAKTKAVCDNLASATVVSEQQRCAEGSVVNGPPIPSSSRAEKRMYYYHGSTACTTHRHLS